MPSNTYFSFKHFKVNQERCAMKVSTDSCAFGAWIPLAIEEGKVLDIGAGTGLLSLMLAQRFPSVTIDAVEIDPNAYAQACENAKESPFASRIQVYQSPIQSFEVGQSYDAIITNPPFFQQSLRSPDQQVNHAKHDTGLTFEVLLQHIMRLLKPTGHWHVLLPVYESEQLELLALEKGWYPVHKTYLSHSPIKQPNRRFTTFAKNTVVLQENCTQNRLNIFDESGKKYNESFVLLLKDFYLAF